MSKLVILPSELMEAPAQIPCLLDGIIPVKSLVGLVAQSGAGKSFLALDICAHLALGLLWQGRTAIARGVLYVVGEGFMGLPGRLRAWCAENETEAERLDRRLAFLRVPLDISDEEMIQQVLDELMSLELEPDMIVLDTVSSNAPPGFNENDTQQMKAFLDAGRALRDRLDCTVFFVHHAGHNAERERGSSDFRAALDVMLFLKTDDGLRTLTMSKGRDFEPFLPIRFRLRSAHDSAVLDYDGGLPGSPGLEITPSMRAALAVLRDEGQGQPLRMKDWQVRSEGRVQKTQFYSLRKRLETGGYVAIDPKRGAVLTLAGEGLLDDSAGSGFTEPAPNRSEPRGSVQSGPLTGGAGTEPVNRFGLNREIGSVNLQESGPGLAAFDWPDEYREAS